MNKKQEYENYIQRMVEIRGLSSPSLAGLNRPEEYGERLRENFTQIGKMAAENREFLEETLFHILDANTPLVREEMDRLCDLAEGLLDAEELENLDLPITAMISDRLLKEAKEQGDFEAQIYQMDAQMSIYYTLMLVTLRLKEYSEIGEAYRKKGMEIGDAFLTLREPENFKAVADETCREMILTNARFYSGFFEGVNNDSEWNKKDLELLKSSIAITDDPFYIEAVPNYDWRYYKFRALEYISLNTDYLNMRGYDAKQLEEIWQYTEELWDLWHTDPDYYKEFDDEVFLENLLLRNRYLANKISKETYLESILKIYQNRSKDNYEITGVIENISIPTEILILLKDKVLSEADKAMLSELYTNVIEYNLRLPNNGILSYFLEYNCCFVQHFIEVPGGLKFEELVLNILAALHPPTYVHTKMVAQITSCLCGRLIDFAPDLFVGQLGYKTKEEVVENKFEIVEFAYHAALCHDTGKLFIIDTVFVYGRRLLDMEFELIKTHPKMGAKILSHYKSTKRYAPVAEGHHKWYDNSRGYPEEFDTSKTDVKTVIDLIACADCLDAATDRVGRSYQNGKSIDEFIEEIKEGSGTRYAPWLVDLLSLEEVKSDLQYLLKNQRNKNYEDTYLLLKNVHEKAN